MYYLTSSWLATLKSAKKSVLVQASRRKVHYTFPDKTELAEEYDEKTNLLMSRKWRIKNAIGGSGKWEAEIGEPEQNLVAFASQNEQIVESFSNPLCYRQDTLKHFQFRIRNLPYPLETYNLTIATDEITVRTTNKKYFKIIKIPDMQRAKLPLDKSKLTFAHSNNTLIIHYVKPDEIINEQNAIVNEIKKTKSSKEGDMECNQS